MPTLINISVEGRKALEWEATEDEIRRLLADVPKLAGSKLHSEQVVLASIEHLSRHGRFVSKDPVRQRGEMVHIVWWVLNAPMNGATVADWAAASRIDVNFKIVRDEAGKPVKVRAMIEGVTRLDG